MGLRVPGYGKIDPENRPVKWSFPDKLASPTWCPYVFMPFFIALSLIWQYVQSWEHPISELRLFYTNVQFAYDNDQENCRSVR